MFRILSSTNGVISNSMSSKKKKVRFINKYFQVLGSYDVPNFDKCYIPSQDSGPSTFAHIVNGNLYYNNYKDGTNDYKPVDTSGDCISCNAGVEYSYGYYIKNSQIHLFKADGRHNLVLEDVNADYDKISDRESASGKPLLLRSLTAPDSPGQLDKLYSPSSKATPIIDYDNTFTVNKPYVDVCGKWGAGDGCYCLDSEGRVYGGLGKITGEIDLCKIDGLRFKYISCNNTNSSGGFAGITTDNLWAVETFDGRRYISTVKVAQITAGFNDDLSRDKYGIGLQGELYYSSKLGKVQTLETSGWQSLAAGGGLSYGAGIKNGKVYKLYGTGITEIPELGNNNIKIEGVHNFLLYSEEN